MLIKPLHLAVVASSECDKTDGRSDAPTEVLVSRRPVDDIMFDVQIKKIQD